MNRQQSELEMLIVKAMEGTLSDQDRLLLNHLMQSPENQKLYFEMIKVNCALKQLESSEYQRLGTTAMDSNFNINLWEQLANEEAMASKVEIPKPEEEPVHIEEVPRNSKGFNFSVIFSVAALLFIVLFIYIVPPVSTSIEVATLTDSIHAKWSDTNTSMQNGIRLLDDGAPFFLRKGLAELRFDTNAHVVIEGPAEFQILAEDRIGLQYGKVYAKVPREAIGFSIYTQNSKIIDMGTEFGVKADLDDATELHVVHGRTTLISGEKEDKKSIPVSEGAAKKISGISSAISDIPCNTKLFVRTFDSKEDFTWRGEMIDLADVVGGGNGFGTGVPGYGINPTNGNIEIGEREDRVVSNRYVSVSSSIFIDGIFVPNGQYEQVVSSAGHQFTECPVTQANCYVNAMNTPEELCNLPIYLEEDADGNPKENPYIFLHPNMGVTFDLNAFRKSLPGVEICQFKTDIGVSKSSQGAFKADFWVLVDGHIRYKKLGVEKNGLADNVIIEISDRDQFLTLITTDGGPNLNVSDEKKSEYELRSWIGRDWCVFSKPVLELK